MKKFTFLAFAFMLCMGANAQRSQSIKANQPSLKHLLKVENAPKKVEGFTPIKESFEAEDNGWTITDAASKMSSGTIFGNSTTPNPAPIDGSAYLTSGYDEEASRNAWAISPAYQLTAGTTYYVSIYAYAPGYGGVNDEFKVTVGKGNTAAAQTTILINRSGNESASYKDWTKVNGEFTPSETGNYNFGIHHCTNAKNVNGCAFDLFEINDAMGAATVKDMLCTGGLWDKGTEAKDVLIGDETNLYFTATASNASSLTWETPNGVTIVDGQGTNTLVANHIPVGAEEFVLTAQNPNGNASASETINTVHYATGSTYYLSNISDDEGQYLVNLGNNEYVFGSNHYYHECAELFDIPSGVNSSVKGFLFNGQSQGLGNAAIKVSINAVAEGNVGTVIQEFTTTADVFFAHEEGQLCQYIFSEAVVVNGPFFVCITFPAIEASDFANKFAMITTTYERPTDYNSSYMKMNNVWKKASSPGMLSPLSSSIIPVVEVSSTEGINDTVHSKTIKAVQYYNISGMPVQQLKEKGIYVKRITYTDGSVKAVKCIK
jgi:hypothetical protein